MTGESRSRGATWGEWINARFDEQPLVKQLDLAAALGLGNSAISKWRKGTHPADVDAVIRAAAFFGRPPLEALRAAGHDTVADLLEALEKDRGDASPDPVATEIMGWTHLSVKVRTALLRQYQSDMHIALERARATAALMDENTNNQTS